MCHLCESSDSLFTALRQTFDSPEDALHVLSLAMFKCIQASVPETKQRCGLAMEIHGRMMERLIGTHELSHLVH